jgi:serine/threonine-protein kinase
MVCLHGHEWDVAAEAAGWSIGLPASCPRCGAPSDPANPLPPTEADPARPGEPRFGAPLNGTQQPATEVAPQPPWELTEYALPDGSAELRFVGSAPVLEQLTEVAPPDSSAITIDQNAQTLGRVDGGLIPVAGTSGTRPEVPGYDILTVLGRGGMGVVYAARQRNLGRVVALKMILAGAHAGPNEFDRFQGEAEALARLHHPNIVQIHEIGSHDGCPYLSLEFVGGSSLADTLRGTPMPAARAAELVETIARAIAGAHDRGILHRDLKPGNILFTPDGIPKITDFGLAKRLDAEAGQTASGSVLGTPSYMAPEQARGQTKRIGPPADIYALGAILYECLTGRPPFRSDSPMETLRQVLETEPVAPRLLNPKVDRDLETIALKALQKEPVQRYASAIDLADDLGRYRRGEPIHARQVSTAERAWRWSKRNPWLAGLGTVAASLLLVLTLGSIVAALVISKERDRAVVARGAADRNAETARNAQRLSERNAEIASEQADLALDAVKSMVGDVQKRLGNKQEFAALRTDLLGMALDRLNRVLRTGKNAGLSGRVMAAANTQVGDIALQLGRRDEAERHYRDALKMAEDLAAAEPDSDLARGNLALIHTKVGQVRAQQGDWPAAREQYEHALELQQDLVDHPKNGDLPHDETVLNLIAFRDTFGRLLLERGEANTARTHFDDALAWREKRLAAKPDDLAIKRELGDACQRLADLYFSAGDRDRMQRYYARCFALRNDLINREPENRQLRFDLKNTGAGFGDKLLFLGANQDALAYYQPALEMSEEMAEDDPANERLQGMLAMALYRVATARLRLGETELARSLYRRNLAIRQQLLEPSPRNPDRRINVMIAQARCGLRREATEIAEELRKESPKNPGTLFQIGCCYSMCAADVGNGRVAGAEVAGGTGTANVEGRARDYGKLALEALRAAVAAGYKDVSSIEHDPDLDAIRERGDFREFLAALKSAPAPRTKGKERS